MGSLLSCFGAESDSTKKFANTLNDIAPICIKEDKKEQSSECVKAKTPTPSQNEGRNKNSPEKHLFIWKIDGLASLFEQGEGCTQTSFEMHGVKWLLSINLMADMPSHFGRQVTLCLEAALSSISPDYMLETKFKFFLYNQTGLKHIEHEASHTYSVACHNSEVACLTPLYNLMGRPWDGFLVNDTIQLGVEFIKFNRVPCNSLQRNTILYKNKSSRLCSWYIDDFFQLSKPAALSEPFQIAGYTWRLQLYSGCGCNKNYVAIYLLLEEKSGSEIPPLSGLLVEAVLSIKRQSQRALERKIRQTYSATAKDWGFPQFIRYEHLIDPSNGYLIKGTCTIEASVSILGTSNDCASEEAA